MRARTGRDAIRPLDGEGGCLLTLFLQVRTNELLLWHTSNELGVLREFQDKRPPSLHSLDTRLHFTQQKATKQVRPLLLLLVPLSPASCGRSVAVWTAMRLGEVRR